MANESVEELVLADSWAGEHEHVRHGGSVDVFIPKWVVWSVTGVGIGVAVWVLRETYLNYRADRVINDFADSYAARVRDVAKHGTFTSVPVHTDNHKQPVRSDEEHAADTVL